MKTLYTTYNNFAKRVLIALIALTTIGVGTILAAEETGTIKFSTDDVKINAASVTAQDNLDNTWTITTVGTTSYTASGKYYQVGSSSKPATSITFTTTLPQTVNITAFSAKFGGFSSTAGNITLKVGETVVGSGNLSATTDVTVESSSTATGTVLTVTVTDIAKGVKCYYISYTYEIDVPEYNVYWVANNEQISADIVEQGSRVTLPSKPADCSNNVVFVGWTDLDNVNGTKPSDLFNENTPNLQLPTINKETTFRAVYAEVVDGVGTFAAGESGTFKLYAIVNGNNYYAGTGIDDRKLTSTTSIGSAGNYTITHISGDQYTIQYGNQYISHANGKVDLEYLEYNEENKSKCHWIITRTGTKGTWRVASPVDDDRALLFTTNSSANVFKAYATSNFTQDTYYDLEIGNGDAISYQNYTTSCSSDVTITLNPNGGTGNFEGWDYVDGNYTKTVEKDQPVTLPTLDDQIAYTFGGWYDENDTKIADGGADYTPEADITLYAQWTPKTLTNYRTLCDYDITWLVGEDSYTAGSPTTTVQAGHTITTLPTNPLDHTLGCCSDKFMGWTTSTAKTIDDQYLYETIEEIQTKFPSIYEDLNFRAVFATTAQGVGTSIADFSEMGYENGTAVTDQIILGDGEGHGDATITLAKAQSSSDYPTYYNDGEAVRVYAGGTITIASTYNGATIKEVVFTFGSGDQISSMIYNKGSYDSEISTWTGDANSVTFTISGSTGHRRIASIQVTTGVSGSQYTNYVTQCTTLLNPVLSGGSVSDIAVNCGDFSTLNNSQAIVFSTMQDLTCPVTFEVIDGDFLISTAKDRAAQYQSKITVTPTKSGENIGKLKNVYVRANATDYTENFTGTIKVTSDEIAEDVIISLTATVTCDEFTLTTIDHLGNETVLDTYFAGEVIATEPTPSSDECTAGYIFDGWSTAEVKYGSLIYNKVSFPYTMPAKDVTLYPVYRINTTEDYHRVTSDLGLGDVDGNNWAGDYLIAYGNETFADGTVGGEDGIGKLKKKVDLSPHISNNSIPATEGDQYKVTLEAVTGGYVLKTKDGKYNYYTNNTDNGISTSINIGTADDYPINVNFVSQDEINLCLTGDATGSVFRYNTTGYFRFYNNSGQKAVYLYKKTPLYTSSLICEEVTAENAMVTSTAGQTVKVNVTATMSNTKIDRTRELTAESDNADFTATITTTATENKYNVAVSYTPSVDDITDGTETANITIKVNAIPVTTFQVTGRHLPENFVIAAKWGDNWYAMPANMDSQSSTEGLLIEVDDAANPTKALAAPNTTKYGLKSVYTSDGAADRYADNGERLVFVENVTEVTPVANKTLYNGGDASSSKTNIQVFAQYKTATGGYYTTNPDRYEWIPTTTNLMDYTLTSGAILTGDAAGRTVSLDNHGIFGTLLQDKSYNGMVRLLPVDDFYTPAELQVVEWKANGLSIMYTGVGTKYTTKVGDNAESSVRALSKIDHAVYSLATTDLTAATNQPLVITIKDDAEATIGAIKLTIPAIVAADKATTELGVAEANAKATSIVVLDGATLTASNTKYTYDDVVVYPGGKLVIGNSGKLGMYTLTLRLGSSWGTAEYEYKYPQFVLNTTTDGAYSNTSGQINLDYVTTKGQYYTFVAPFEVKTKDIKYPIDIYGTNVATNNSGSFEFEYYDGAARAAGNTGWTTVAEDPTNGATLTPGQGYTFLGMPKKVSVNGATSTRQKYGIHRIPMKVGAARVQDHENADQTVPLAVTLAEKDNDSGWNIVGNPYMSEVTGLTNDDIQVGKLVHTTDANDNWTGGWHWDTSTETTNQRFLVIPSNDGQSYEAVQASNATLHAFKHFFVQIQNASATAMSIPVNNRVDKNLAPARYAQAEIEKDIEIAVQMIGDKLNDQMDFLINDIYSTTFEKNADFTKMMNATNFNIYGVHVDNNLSFVALDKAAAMQSVAIGFQVPKAGEYQLSLSDKPYVMADKIEALFVTDHEASPEVTTNLVDEDYTFYVNQAETNNTRFTVSIILKPDKENTPTGVDNINTKANQPIKFLYQEKIYILRNGMIYDTTGKQVITINK